MKADKKPKRTSFYVCYSMLVIAISYAIWLFAFFPVDRGIALFLAGSTFVTWLAVRLIKFERD